MSTSPAPPTALLCSTRFNLALISFLGCVIIYALRSNISFAIVCMVRTPAEQLAMNGSLTDEIEALEVPKTEKCSNKNSFFIRHTEENGTTVVGGHLGEFDWSKNTQGTILSAFFWGYLTSQVLGGYLAARIGAKRVIFGGVALSAVVTLLSPQLARVHVSLFVALRVALGFAQGSIFPAMHTMWSHWAPPLERSILTGVSYAGAQIGNVLVMPLSGFLCGSSGGWPSIFYLLGVMAIGWCALWLYYGSDRPETHKKIKEPEKSYIVESLNTSPPTIAASTTSKPQHHSVPITAILRSLPVWAIFIGHFAGDWGAYTMATSIPTFLNDVLGLELSSMGMLSSVPYILYFVMINVGGFVADKLRNSGALSTVNTRRAAMLVALGGQALFLVAIGHCRCGQELLVIVLLTLSVGISGLQYSGFVVNYLDVGPAFAGTLLGIGNTLSCLAGVLSPLIMGWLTPTGSKEEWRMVFYVTGAVLVVGATFFAIFCSGDVQPWAKEAGSDWKEGQEMTPLTNNGADAEKVTGGEEPLLENQKEKEKE